VNPAYQQQGHLLQIVFLQHILCETIGQTPPLHNGKEDSEAAIAVRDEVFFHGEFPRQG